MASFLASASRTASVGKSAAPDELAGWAESLKTRAKGNPQQLKQELLRGLAKFFGHDPKDQVAGLEFLEELAEQANNQDLKTVLDQLRNEWREQPEMQPAILAGENIAGEVESFSLEGLALSPELRDFYRQIALGCEPIQSMYALILKRYGKKKFYDATDYLLEALGTDISSPTASREVNFLVAVRNDILHLQSIRGLHQDLENLLAKMDDLYG